MRCSTRISGMADSRNGAPTDGEYHRNDENLDYGQRRDGTDHAPLEILEHRYADDLRARLLQEDDGVVVVEQRDEHEHESCEEGRSEDGKQDPPGGCPPSGTRGTRGAIE